MAEENNNKRAIIGVTIFAVLIIANLIVRGRSRPTAPPRPAQPAIQDTQPQPAAAPGPSVSIPADSTGIDEQILFLNQMAEQFYQRVSALPEPASQPDISIQLPASMTDRLVWELPASGPLIVEPDITPDIPEPKLVTLLGEFQVDGKRRYLVRENNRVFIVDETHAPEMGSVAIVSNEDGQVVVKDTIGMTHNLTSAQPVNKNFEEALRILKGDNRGQVSFELMSSPPLNASQTREP